MQSSIKTLLPFILVIILLQLSCKNNSTGPEIGKWELLGLEEILVNDLKLIDNYLYACAGKDGLFRLNLNNSNNQWEYLGFADKGLYKQLDYGVTSIVKIPSTNELLIGIATHRDSSETGLFRSSDNGITWTTSDSGIGSEQYQKRSEIVTLIIDIYSTNTLYAGLTATIYKSIDGGLSWNLKRGIHGTGLGINSIIIAQTKPNQIWAGGESSRFAPYLLHSTNFGETWSDPIRFPENFGPFFVDNAVYDIAIDPNDENTLYFGMLGVIGKTTDKGETFQRILGWDDGIYRYWRLGMNPNNSNEIFATGFYLYRTLDGGKTWQKIEPPFYEIYALAINWQHRVLYVSVSSPENGIYKMRF